ncbi:chromate efflux transporter [Nocardioides albidus]|uniref:Chromate efflux transporter n=1 Tax=Nocardioides albidus TaxID=1517589 RepID=A0A5C4VS66_9ACTN|nr:chromate efflux transporter [Nocardioides albidus]TNM38366.1 chromate efflux transporter [Nocardioides albidus]
MPGDVIPLREATRAWFQISLQTFGGPAGQIAVMQHKLVDERRWIGQRRFLHALNYCMLLPGPEAQQLAIYTGWLLNGIRGGLIAGGLFVLPGMLALLALSGIYVGYGETDFVTALFAGVAPAVIAIVVQAVQRVGKRALHHPALVGLAVASFAALTFFAVPFPAVVFGAGLLGWLLSLRIPALRESRAHDTADGTEPLISDEALHHELPTVRRSGTVLLIGLVTWFTPVVAFAALAGSTGTPVFVDQGLFFSGAAVVTFGGAYAVLSYVAQQAVGVYHWLAPGEMIRGLALAETTPGPLIMVVQFVAFVGAYRNPGSLDPWLAAVLASLLVTWVTFVPCFLFVLLGAPYVERLRSNRGLTAALTGITAAVVGVIANLAVFFALHNLFDRTRTADAGPVHLDVPVLASWDPVAFAITAVALGVMFGRGWSPLRTLGLCAAIGVGLFVIGAL